MNNKTIYDMKKCMILFALLMGCLWAKAQSIVPQVNEKYGNFENFYPSVTDFFKGYAQKENERFEAIR